MKNGAFADFKIFSGNSNPELAEEIASIMGKPLGRSTVSKFSDGEISVNLWETVRGVDAYIIQSTCNPVNDNLMELLIMIDAMKRASAGRINAVIPYYGYARQDRKAKARDPITAKLVADLISAAGADRVVTMDLHAAQIQGYFNIPVDHLLGMPILVKYFKEKRLDDLVIVSPDHGSVGRARNMAHPLDAPIAIIDKRRPKANVSEIMNIIGDIEGKKCNPLGRHHRYCRDHYQCCQCAEGYGRQRRVCLRHPCGAFGTGNRERIQESAITEMILLNTIPLPEEKRLDKMKILSVAPLFAETIPHLYQRLRQQVVRLASCLLS